jgi:transmembrane sensor
MDEEFYGPKLARYIAGECSVDEANSVRAWAQADPARAELLEALTELWSMTTPAAEGWDVDRAWERLVVARAQEAEEVTTPTTSTAPSRILAQASTPSTVDRTVAGRGGFRGFRLLHAAAIAAVVLTPLMLRGRIERMLRPASEASEPRFVETARGQQAHLRLADGSRVVLAPESRLSYRQEGNRREVDLEGEAVFEVVHDAERPFVVRSGSALTEDLGTEFAIRAYPSDSTVRVVVREGSVAISATGASGTEPVELARGEVGVVAQNGTITEKPVLDLAEYFGWTEGRLVFNGAKVGYVVAEIGRWRNVDIRVLDPSLADQSLTITLDDQPLDDVLGTLAIALDADYHRQGSRIELIPREQRGSR